ncbi:MAG: hypothetical protein AAF224_06620 [Pseudomonadota bacterium]
MSVSVERWERRVLVALLCFWAASGVLIALAPPVDAERSNAAPFEARLELQARNYVSPGRIIAAADGPTEIRLRAVRGGVFYETVNSDRRRLFNAFTAEEASPLTGDEAAAIAKKALLIDETEAVDVSFIPVADDVGDFSDSGGHTLWRISLGTDGRIVDVDPLTGVMLSSAPSSPAPVDILRRINKALLSREALPLRIAGVILTFLSGGLVVRRSMQNCSP